MRSLPRISQTPSLTAGLLCLCVAIFGCTPSGAISLAPPVESSAGLQGKLVLTGSSTVAPLVAEIANRFESLHPEVRIDVQAGGSGKGISDARLGQADIGMASRALTGDERDLVAHPIANDGVCLIVHRSNPVSELSPEQVVAIYTDRVNDWSQIGGAQQPIQVVHKAEGRATLEVFLKHFGLNNPDIRPDVIAGHNEQAIQSVAQSPGAVGYVSIGTAEADVQAGIPIKLLPLHSVAATRANVASGDFPMSRPLNLITGPQPGRLAQAFIDFAQSRDVHDLIEQQYFIPLAD